ncbi:K(+)/H(+) antiporter NhaP2 [Gammaproteobacteria bacterium]|nr:K(+)/H(+) antiporter NhaP2 [Gammaproteobacteria bacterium]
MDFVNIPLLAASSLMFLALVSGLLTAKLGLPFLLVFLAVGALAGEEGLGGLRFDDFTLSFWVGNVALAVILLDGGLRTSFTRFRTGLKPSLLLATVGVVVTSLVTGAAATWFLGLEWRLGLLLGAIVGSTDAAAVFVLLKSSGVRLNERVGSTLEIESGMNDPMAVFLTMALIALVTASPGAQAAGVGLIWSFVQQFGIGSAAGLGAGWAMTSLLGRIPREHAGDGLVAMLLISSGLAVFAGTGWAGGSGFLAIYLFGMVVANRSEVVVAPALPAMDGYAWLSQGTMFLLLGLLVIPSQALAISPPALAVAAVLMLVARPIAVWLCLAPFRFRPNEVWFISWVGLRGAVPIVLAIFPLMAGVPNAMLLFNVAFVVVLVSLVLQGTTIGMAGRRFAVDLPEVEDERQTRAVFGDFVLDGRHPAASLCEFYELPPVVSPDLPIGEWLARELGRAPVVGDQLRWGSAFFSVRAMDGSRITRVGLRLDEQQ